MTLAPSWQPWRLRRPTDGPGSTRKPEWPATRLVVGAAALLVAGVAAHLVWMGQVNAIHDRYLSDRATVQTQKLAAQNEPFIALAGDSHAEMLTWDRLCDLPIVNLGMSGARVETYSALAERVTFGLKPSAILLFIGTNDLARSSKIRNSRDRAVLEMSLRSLIATLSPATDRLFYVPPVPGSWPSNLAGGAGSGTHDPASAGRYPLAAQDICRVTDCRVIAIKDPAMSSRDDGVHLDVPVRRTGGPLHRWLEETVCPELDRSSGALFDRQQGNHAMEASSPDDGVTTKMGEGSRLGRDRAPRGDR